jgi:hypothetical protein
MLYTEPRYTRDLDVFISRQAGEVEIFRRAFAEFGFALTEEQTAELCKEDRMLSIGRAPVQIDVTNRISGIDFEEAYSRRRLETIDGLVVSFMSLQDLIENKRSTGRAKDALDLENLIRARDGGD